MLINKTNKSNFFEQTSQINIDKKIYIVERHFTGKREITEAINTVVINSLKYDKKIEKTA
jgi:hypothetical protein